MTRVCLDSNVFVAGFPSRGLCADLVRLVLTEHELGAQARSAAEAVLERCEIAPRSGTPCPMEIRYPDEERVLLDARAGRAEILVIGDNHLLAVADQSPIPILSPRGFMTLARGSARQGLLLSRLRERLGALALRLVFRVGMVAGSTSARREVAPDVTRPERWGERVAFVP